MNKIEGLKKLSEIGFEVYNYTIYHNDSNLNTLNKNKKYLLRRSSKNNIGEVFLGVEHNLSIDELLKKVIELNSSFDLIIQEEKIIDYYGSVSRISDGNYYILSIELFDTLENRISGIHVIEWKIITLIMTLLKEKLFQIINLLNMLCLILIKLIIANIN